MAIQNLNSLNNPAAFDINAATEEYLIQALANLGQRYSIKGDGIGITTIKFADLFTADVSGYDSKSHIGKVSYDPTGQNVSISIVKNDLTPIANAETISMSESNTNYVVDNSESPFTTMVNETGLVRCSDTLVYSDEHSIVYSLIEHTGTDNDEPRYVCQKYNKYTNELVSGLRIMKTGNEASGKTHSIIYVQKTSETSNKIYYLCYIFDVSLDNSEDSSTLGSYTVSNDGEPTTINMPFTINGIATKFVRYHGLNPSDDVSEQELNYAFTPESVFSQIYTAVSGQMTKVAYTGENNSSVSLSKADGTFTCTGDILKYSYNINMFTYDKTYVYSNIKEYYSTSYYKSGVNSKSLINKVLKGLLALAYGGAENQSEIYIPLDYAFEYAYNDKDPWQVYFSTHDVAIRFASLAASKLSSKSELVFSLNDNAAIICVTTGPERMAFYNYEIEYENSNDDKNIYGVRVFKHFELPYINEYGYWVINGVSTEMYAHGKDAGNPNIVIVESVNGETQPNIITMADKDYFASLPWVWKTAKIKLPAKYIKDGSNVTIEETKINSNNYVECRFMVPSISAIDKKTLEEHIDKLKYSILINIAKVNLINDYKVDDDDDDFTLQVNNIFGVDGRMSSIWVLDEENGRYDFECKTYDDGYAIDFNYMTNMDNLIGFAISNYIPADPDNFMFSHVVFDAPDYATKQQDYGRNASKVYPTILNTPYAGNKFNMSIRYLDTIEAKYYEDRSNNSAGKSLSYEITSISQSVDRRYLDEWFESKSSDYNLYPTYQDYIPNSTNYSVPILDLGETLVKDNNVLNRVNIMTLENGTAYYSYIGSLYYNDGDKVDKSVFVIGTSERNINLGTETLVSSIDETVFTPQREIDINFDNTRISAYAYVGNDAIFERDTITYGTNWTTNFIGESYYWNCSFIPVGEYYKDNTYLSTVFNEYSANIDKADGTKMFARAYLRDTIIENERGNGVVDIYMCDAVDVKCLLNKVMPQVNIDHASITSNKSIIKYSGDPVLITLSTKNYTTDKIYHGSQLNISYYMSSDTPYIEINENESFSTLVVPQKLNLDYTVVVQGD